MGLLTKVLEAIERPTYILPGHRGSLIAVLPIGRAKHCMWPTAKLAAAMDSSLRPTSSRR